LAAVAALITHTQLRGLAWLVALAAAAQTEALWVLVAPAGPEHLDRGTLVDTDIFRGGLVLAAAAAALERLAQTLLVHKLAQAARALPPQSQGHP
jgi:hypothetical protein